MSLFLGSGGGAFQSAKNTFADAGVTVPTDLDGDGNLSLIVAGGGSFQIFLGTGAGTFVGPQYLPFGGSPGMAFADFDGDGVKGLAIPAGYYVGCCSEPVRGRSRRRPIKR